jgi:hypothetical protein
MSKLYLYSVFHGNLNYSSIPQESYHEIIDKCYWPILDAVNNFKFKTGIEFPTNTLDKIGNIDPFFIEELKKTVRNKKCEIICSSKEQVVFPLVPEDINKINLQKGRAEVQKQFRIKCETAFINEQIFSSGLIPLYITENFKNIILIRDGFFNFSLNSTKNDFTPAQIFHKNKRLNIIWNSYFTYKQFQQYIAGKISKPDYIKFINSHKQKNDSCFPLYGSDLEIFVTNPVLGLNSDDKKLERFYQILEEIEKMPDLEFILPSQLIKKFASPKEISIDSAKFSILEKKPNISIVRWATCGRDNSKTNSICYQLLKKLRILTSLSDSKKNNLDKYYSKLIDCWASDYRTHTIETKRLHFNKIANLLNNKLESELKVKLQKILNKTKTSDLILLNPSKYDWNRLPFELKLHFKPGIFSGDIVLYSDNKEIPSQLEEKRFYKDGSLLSTTIIFEPLIKQKSCININLDSNQSDVYSTSQMQNELTTSNVELKLLHKKGAAISELTFPKIEKNSMIQFSQKKIAARKKPYYDYSGYTVAVDRSGNKYTDLVNTTIFSGGNSDLIRSKLFCNIDLPFAHLTKIFYVYENHPRLDIKYIFNFKEFRPSAFRVGIITLNPNTFNRKNLCYSTHNGGKLESFVLDNNSIIHDKLLRPNLTKQSCLGSTEGLVDFGDNKKGISIFSNNSTWYSVPMINYSVFNKSFFYQIRHSASDLDDTTMTWWKGRKEISFCYIGRSNNLDQMDQISHMLFLGLVCISKNKNIVVI